MISRRHIFTGLAFLGNMANLLCRDSLRIASLAIREETESCHLSVISSDSHSDQLYQSTSDNKSSEICKQKQWTDADIAQVLSGFNYGMIITMTVGGPLSDIFGGKILLFTVSLVSGLITLLLPLLVDLGYLWVLVAAQVLYGMSGGLVVPALSTMIVRWEPLSERGVLSTIVYSGSKASVIFSSLFTGYITYKYNWRLVFYSLGVVPILWTIPWLAFVSDSPLNSRKISKDEKILLIRETSISTYRPGIRDIPIFRILTSGPVWGIVVANMGVIWAETHTAILLPQYMDQVLGMPIHHTGLYSCLPYIGCAVIGLLSSLLFRWITKKCGVGGTMARKISSTICLWGFAVFTLPILFVGPSAILVTLFSTMAFSLIGFNLVGAWSNPLDIAPNYVGTIMGVTGLFSYLAGALVPHTPALMSVLLPGHDIWTMIFITVIVITIVTNLVFLVTATAELQPWNSVDESSVSKHDYSVQSSRSIFDSVGDSSEDKLVPPDMIIHNYNVK